MKYVLRPRLRSAPDLRGGKVPEPYVVSKRGRTPVLSSSTAARGTNDEFNGQDRLDFDSLLIVFGIFYVIKQELGGLGSHFLRRLPYRGQWRR